MLARLSPAERLALVLHKVFECPHADIAAALGIKPDNARQHLARARRRLRKLTDNTPPNQKLCRELIRRFHAALHGADIPAMTMLLGGDQPMFVSDTQVKARSAASANDACYRLTVNA
jgi:hypothetical protein